MTGRAAGGVRGTLVRARDHLVRLQHPEGWWKGELATNVTMDAEDVLLRHFLGILDPGDLKAAAGWIEDNRRADGAWSTFYGGPGDISTTVEAYVALRLAGHDPADEHMSASAAWVRAHGGVENTRVFTRIWLAMVGAWGWETLPVLPAEMILLPAWAPLNIYDFACWARQTIVALTIVMAHRPVRPLPFEIDELTNGQPRPIAVRPELAPGGLASIAGRFLLLDRVLHRYQRRPVRRLRDLSLRRAEQWILRRQEADGLWGGIQPPVVYTIIALHLQGYSVDHPVLAAAMAGLDGFILDDERGRRVEACQSPVWDTALAMVALADAAAASPAAAPAAGAGHTATDFAASPGQALLSARRWLIDQEIRMAGDWAVRRPRLEPSGWAFEFANANYPDIDDTAEVVIALRRAGARIERPSERLSERDADEEHAGDAACRRAVQWVLGLQSRGGGWGAFDVDNTSDLVAALPFCDFGKVTDPPSADVTAHVIEMLADEPGIPRAALDQAVAWLCGQQEPDGSWFGRWGVNYVYGTGAAVPALIKAGVTVGDQRIRRAVEWLEIHQNPDGGWGEDLRSYVDDTWHGRGASTASQTAWALLALLAAGERQGPAAHRGVEFLVRTQTDEGTWDEPWFTGTGFPWDFSINYHLYRLVWPIMALGRYLADGAQP